MMLPHIDRILSKLSGVRATGANQHESRCPAHDDSRASLSIGVGKNDRALIHCHAGCTSTQVLRAIGLPLSALFADSEKQNGRIVATYDYVDADGVVLYQSVRLEPKTFRQRHSDGKGGWIWDMRNVRRVLYRLPELLNANEDNPESWRIVCEGEKDVDRLRSIGFLATCNVGGAGKWKDEYNGSLSNHSVVIIVDKDAPGRAHGQQVARSLVHVASVVKTLELPGDAVKDASDWISAGGTADQLQKLIDTAPVWAECEVVMSRPDNFETSLAVDHEKISGLNTDVGNASRFVNRHGENVRYCYERGKWLIWRDPGPWSWDESGQIVAKAKETALAIFDEARAAESDDERAKLASHAVKTQKKERLTAMTDLAKPDLAIPLRSIDANAMLFGCSNGVINLSNGSFTPHRRENFITCVSPVQFDANAKCPQWLSFIDRIMAGNQNLVGYLSRLAGLCITGSIRTQEFFILFGDGGNGKSVFVDTLAYIFGEYFKLAPESLLIARHGGGNEHPTEIAGLRGKRLVVCSETEEGGRLRIQLVKKMTGDATLSGRFMRCDYIEFNRTFKLILITNNKPDIRESTNAIWRRIRLIPFDVIIQKHEVDEWLLDKLKEEAPGILNWIIAGCLDWQSGGMRPPEEVLVATRKYQADADPLADFVGTCLVTGDFARVSRSDLWDSYQAWAARTKERHSLEKSSFFDRIRRLSDVQEKMWKVDGRPIRGFSGVGICVGDDAKADDVDAVDSDDCPL